MHSPADAAQRLDHLLTQDLRYPMQAYGVILSALHATISKLPQPRHISGPELAEGFRDYVLDQFGPMTLMVLNAWNVRSTEDVGAIVFNLVDVGLLTKTEDDRREQFEGLYDFQDAFGRPFPYLSTPSAG
jgi:uncharacterized repeat protein (TIGR04138 family)